MDRRAKAERYFDRPHLKKEAARIMGFTFALVVANFAYFRNSHGATFGSYVFDALYCAVYRVPDGADKLLAALAYVALIATLTRLIHDARN
jgi:hypothetical protein